jgi:antitoxin component YwqK of YwqJK toxin-antitoxin module
MRATQHGSRTYTGQIGSDVCAPALTSVRSLTLALAMAQAGALACSSPPPREGSSEPALVPRPIVRPIVAGFPDAGPPPACPRGASAVGAAPPEGSAIYCTRPDGTRDGPFTEWDADSGQPTWSGSYRDGARDGHFVRRGPSGAIAEEGDYAAGRKHGVWRQRGADGAVLGEYTMVRGTGIERWWHPNGVLAAEIGYHSGVRDGTTARWDDLGLPTVVESWSDGALDGDRVLGTVDTMRIEEHWSRGVRVGARRIWRNSALALEESYDGAGKRHGAWSAWRGTGRLRERGTYRHGERDGTWTWYDASQQPEKIGTYDGGLRVGTWTEWKDGRKVWQGSYVADHPDGTFIAWDSRGRELGRYVLRGGDGVARTWYAPGKVATEMPLRAGKRQGRYREWYLRGQLAAEGTYDDDLRQGPYREWYADGTPRLEAVYKAGKLDGEYRRWLPSGALDFQATYASGILDGPFEERWEDGELESRGRYRDGARTGTWEQASEDGKPSGAVEY